MKNIIFINRFYFPDHSATAQLLTDLAEHLVEMNMQISVVASRQLYENSNAGLSSRETINGVKVYRVYSTTFGRSSVLGRAIDYLSFYISLFFFLIWRVKKSDLIVAKTDPPLVSTVVSFVCLFKKANFINWLQDLYPEVASKLGVKYLTAGPLYKFLEAVRNWSLNRASNNVVLGELMSERISQLTLNPSTTVIIPNWVVKNDMRPVSRKDNSLIEKWGLSDKFIVGYSGNLGKAHDYETILKCVELCSCMEDVIFLFVGNGDGYIQLQNIASKKNLQNIVFKGYQPIENLASSLSVPDVHMISLLPELEGLIVPSKLYGILSVKRPILFLGHQNGEIAKIIDAYGIGITISDKNAEDMKAAIETMKNEPAMLNEMAESARSLYDNHYTKKHSLIRWELLLKG